MALGRASLLLFAPCALVWLWLCAGGSSRHRRRLLIAYVLGIALVIAPVTVRNAIVGGDLVLISSNGGLNLFIGNNPLGRGTYVELDQVAKAAGIRDVPVDVSWMMTDPSGRRLAEAATGRPLEPSAVSAFYAERTWDYVRAEPGRALRILGRKVLLFWNATEIAQIEDPALYRELIPLLRAPLLTFGVAGPLGLLGLVFALGKEYRRRSLLLTLYAFAFTTSVVLFFVTARYRAPLVPVILLLAALAVCEVVNRIRRATGRGAVPIARALLPPLLLLSGSTALVHLDLVEINRAASYISLGIALADEGRDDEAIAAFERAVASAPGDPVARYNLGAAYLKAGRHAQARTVFEESVQRTPRSAACWGGLGESLVRLGDSRRAAIAFRNATALEPRDPALWARLAVTERASGRPDSGIAALSRALALDPESSALLQMMDEMRAVPPRDPR
jgi:Flp pilus assembly protein TadD